VLQIRLANLIPAALLPTVREIYNTYRLHIQPLGQPIAHHNFPVLIFSPGGSNLKEDYLGLGEQIASLGVVVILMDHHQYEDTAQAFYDPRNGTFHVFDQAPDPKITKGYAGRHMRGEDLRHVVNEVPAIDEQLGGVLDPERVFLAGHSASGAAAYYAARFEAPVRGYINIDGSFEPQTWDEAFGPKVQDQLYLLCSARSNQTEDSPDLCNEKILDDFTDPTVNQRIDALPPEVRMRENFIRQPDLSEQLRWLRFRIITGKAKIVHEDWDNLSLFEQLVPALDLSGTRKQRLTAREIWHFTAHWLYDIVRCPETD
jgi:dienelactone hydrolase